MEILYTTSPTVINKTLDTGTLYLAIDFAYIDVQQDIVQYFLERSAKDYDFLTYLQEVHKFVCITSDKLHS